MMETLILVTLLFSVSILCAQYSPKLYMVTKKNGGVPSYILEAKHISKKQTELSYEAEKAFKNSGTVLLEITTNQKDIGDTKFGCVPRSRKVKDYLCKMKNLCESDSSSNSDLEQFAPFLVDPLKKMYKAQGNLGDTWFNVHWKKMKPGCLALYLDGLMYPFPEIIDSDDFFDDWIEKSARNMKKRVENLETILGHFPEMGMSSDVGFYYLLSYLK